MPQSLAEFVKEAMEIRFEDFVHLISNAIFQLSREKGKVGNITVTGRLIELEPIGEALIIGEPHGDVETLVDIMKQSEILNRMKQNPNFTLVFLGDYGDRGPFPIELYAIVLKLKLLYPSQVILMRGNHEGPKDLPFWPHDLPQHLESKFGKEWNEAYASMQRLFGYLYNAVIVPERYLMIHGGLPSQLDSAEHLAFAHSLHPEKRFLESILWSDPEEIREETMASPRGAGSLFGENVTIRILSKLGVKILIRGHQECEEGYKINHHGRVLTLFSRKGPPYHNKVAAYLDIDLSAKYENANQLTPYIHRL